MTDPRIEAAAHELNRLFSEGEQADDAMWLSCAKCVLDAADAAACVRIDQVEGSTRAVKLGGGNG